MQKAALLDGVALVSAQDEELSLEQAMAYAIAGAGDPSCEGTNGWWVFDRERGVAVPRSCKRWECASCRRFKRLAVLVALQHGISTFHEAGHEIHALTLTDGDGSLDFGGFHLAWGNRLRPWLRRHGHVHAYASALEVQPRSGRLHCHTLLVAPAESTGFVPHAELTTACERAGLGFAFIQHVTDIPDVQAALSGYLVKGATNGAVEVTTQAAGKVGSYMAKAREFEALAGLAGSRLRPFRVSRNWPLNLTSATAKLREELYGEPVDGSWQIVHESRVSKWLDPLRTQRREAEARAGRWKNAAQVQRVVGSIA